MTYECEENQLSMGILQGGKGGPFASKEEVEKACNENDKCLGYNNEESKIYHLLGSKIYRACKEGVFILPILPNSEDSCEDFTLCVKKAK